MHYNPATMLRLGIIGAGHFAKAHIEALGRLQDRVRVTRVARRDAAKGFPEAEAAGAAIVSAEHLIASHEVDAVTVCVTNDLHRRFAEAALRAGKHVFCEKPLAMNVEDADAVIEAARESGGVLLVGHLARHLPVYAKVAEILESGSLGEPRAVYLNRMHCGGGGRSWRMAPGIGGGVVFDLLIHDFDLLTWYLGRPLSVTAQGHRHRDGAYDYLAAIFSCPGGAIALVEGGFVFRPPAGLRSMTRVVCEKGHVEVNTCDKEAPVRVFREGKPEERIAVQLDNLLVQGLLGEYGEFIAAIDGNGGGRLHYEDARQAVACAVAAVEAADTGKAVSVGNAD